VEEPDLLGVADGERLARRRVCVLVEAVLLGELARGLDGAARGGAALHHQHGQLLDPDQRFAALVDRLGVVGLGDGRGRRLAQHKLLLVDHAEARAQVRVRLRDLRDRADGRRLPEVTRVGVDGPVGASLVRCRGHAVHARVARALGVVRVRDEGRAVDRRAGGCADNRARPRVRRKQRQARDSQHRGGVHGWRFRARSSSTQALVCVYN